MKQIQKVNECSCYTNAHQIREIYQKAVFSTTTQEEESTRQGIQHMKKLLNNTIVKMPA